MSNAGRSTKTRQSWGPAAVLLMGSSLLLGAETFGNPAGSSDRSAGLEAVAPSQLDADREESNPAGNNRDLRGDFGVEPVALRRSAAGYMLDFRYRILDAGKASDWIKRGMEIYLVDEETGARLHVPAPPKIGPLRQTSSKLREGRSYFVFFANPGRFLKPDDKVTVVMGNARFEGLVVQ